ncbi:uncharacterized protein LOC135345186 isoform X3 [Halichondria panicea]|uniref:uncharacterized protein LOC135345186 isoform X3 n=1 Tax=Halichondria panicea TaxID=6063 RepID=UPI00312B614C
MGHDCGNVVVEALRDCLSLPTIKAPTTFCAQKQEDVSRQISVYKKHNRCPMNLKQNCVHTETEQYKYSPGVNMALVVSFKRRLQILEVILMLLIIAGDVETNPGPVDKLTPLNIFAELVELTDPVPFGKELGIPQLELDRIQNDNPNDINKQKMALCQYIVTNCELHRIDWNKIADALRRISMEHLAVKIRESYCQQDCSSSNSSTEYLSAEEELPQTVPLSGQLTPDRQVQLPAVQDGEKQSHSRTRRIRGEPKKQQEQETSDASASATMGPPEPSTEAEEQDVVNTLHARGSQVAMIKCLSLWKGHDLFKAKYTALLEVLLRLEKGEIANNVCLYLAAKNTLRDCLSLPTIEAPTTFCVQKQEDISRQISVYKKHNRCPMNLKQNCVHTETEQYKHSPSVPMALVVSFKRTLQILEVLLMLLIIAGDVETNPGPVHKLTSLNLFAELRELTNPIPFGKEVGIPQLVLNQIRDDHPDDAVKQKMALCQCIATNYKLLGIDWEKIADALRERKLAMRIRWDYCHYAGQPLTDCQVQQQHERKLSYYLDRSAVKKQKQETSGASVSVNMISPGPKFNTKVTIEELMERHHLTRAQLNRELGDRDSVLLAKDFDNIRLYPELMNLDSAEKQDVLNTLCTSSQVAMSQCLSFWTKHNPLNATYIALLKIILELGAGKTADNVCRYLAKKKESSGAVIRDFLSLEQMYQKFRALVIDTIKEIQRRFEVCDLIITLQDFLKKKWYFSTQAIAVDCLDSLQTFDDVEHYLLNHYCCSWFDYELIEDLRNEFLFTKNSSKHDSVLSDYEENFKMYVSRRRFIFDTTKNTGQHDNPIKEVEVNCKTDLQYNQLSYEVIQHLKHFFTNILGASKYNLCFKRAREGCTELIFGAPPYFGEIHQLSQYQKSQLKAHGFLKVTIMEQTLFEVDPEEVGLKDSGSVSCLGNSEISSTCSEADNETRDGEEADIDTTDLEYTSTGPGSKVEVTYDQILTNICENELELQEEMDLDVSPCSLWKALHNGQQCMGLKYNGKDDILKFSEFIEDVQQNKPNVIPAKCVHFDTKLSSHPIILFEVEQPFKEYCFSSETVSEMQQLSLLWNASISVLGFSSSITIQLTTESLFVHKASTDDTKAIFLPMYEHSYFHQLEPKTQPVLNWLKDTLLVMVHLKQYSINSELPENHILFNIFKHKWFSDDKPGCLSITDVAKELEHILDLEKTRLELIDTLADSEYLEVPHLHMFLIGHTGVGKTSIRKHLQNIPFNNEEKSTIIMEQELLYQETFESTVDSNKRTVVFEKYDSVYKSDPDKIYLTLWDTGGQPMFQDLLPCFAKFRSIYGIVVRLCDLLDNSNASIRPTFPLEIEREAPYTSTDYLYRCLSFIDSTSFDLHLSNLPDILKKRVFEAANETAFPKVAFIGTFKDQIKLDSEDKQQDLEQVLFRLKDNLETDFLENVILPSTSAPNSVMFEIDNTQSGAKYDDDPGMKTLREQIVSCTKSAKAKIPRKWIDFKIDLERESRLQKPCTGVVAFEKASKIADLHKTDLRAALCYFHELGIFIWYHDKKNLQEYVFVEPKNLLSILGTILDPQVYTDLPEQWKQLQTQGILNVQVCEKLLADSKTGIPLSWILSFFEEHHLAIPLLEGYFIPSMLQVLPICPNHQHVFKASISACSVLQADLEVAPLFLVPKSKFVSPGFFPRLMTVLSGIKKGSIIWKLSPDFINCKNIVSFEINNQFRLVFTEFIDCVRAHFDGLTDDNIPHHDLCLQIVSTLNVQLQRVVNTKSIRLTFLCSCSEHSSSTNFLKYLPFATDNHVSCGEHVGKQMELTTAQKIWLTDEHHPKIATLKDAEARFEAAMKENKFGLRFTTILFTGVPGSDVNACKQMIMDKNFTPFESPHSLDPIQSGADDIEFSYYTVSDEKIKPLHDDDLDMVFACNAAVQTPKLDESEEPSVLQGPKEASSGNDESDEHSTQQGSKEVLSHENPETKRSKQEKVAQSIEKEVDVPKSILASTSLTYKPIPEETLLTCIEDILQLMVNRDRSLTTDYDNLNIINCVCYSDIWLLDVLPIFLKAITIGIKCISIRQDLEEEIFLQEISVTRDEETRISVTSQQIIKDISMLSTKLMVVGKHTKFESIETTIERKNEILFADNGQAKLIKDGKQAVFEVGKSSRETENIERQLVSSLALSEQKHVSLSFYTLGHAIKKFMRQYNRPFISKQEISIIATKIGLSPTDLEIALLNLHMNGLILYYGNVLPNVIFKDSTILLKIVAKIRLISAYFPLSTIEACNEMYAEGLFTCRDAISLFKDLNVLIELENSFFLMPCLLREEVSVETFSSIFGVSDTKVAPLVIQCSLARGSFEYIMCYLCSQYNGHPWPWKINRGRSFFKNCAQFVLPGVNALITLYRNEDAEMTVYINSMEDHEILPSIRTAIVTGLNIAAETFHISGQALPVVGFHCTCDQDNNTHMIVLSKEDHWRCSVTNEVITVSTAQDIWFTKTYDGSDTVTVHNVFAELILWSSSWYKVGMLFNLEIDVLETITLQYRQDTDAALMEVIRKWFHTHHNPSWEEVQHIFSNLIVSDASLTKQRYSMTEDVFKKCLPNLMHNTSVATLLPYLLKYRLVRMSDIDSVQSLYLDNSTKITNLLNLTNKNGGKNGFGLLYNCLFKTSEEHQEHDEIVQELKRCALSCSPIAIDPPSDIDHAVESVDALIKEVSDHIGRDWSGFSTDRTIGGNVLSIDDLHDVFDAVIYTADKWYYFGFALKVDEFTLRQIKANNGNSDCRACLRETLSHWLRNGQSTTWQDIIRALCSRFVDQRKIAENIAQSMRGLTLPATPRTFSASEDVSKPSGQSGDYMSISRDGLSKEHRGSSIASMTSLNSPTHAGPSDFPHDLQWNTRRDISALRMSSPIDAAVYGDTAYFRPYHNRNIYSYNLTRGWSTRADCLVRNTSLVVLPVPYKGAYQFLLYTIGGIKRKIHRQNEDEGEFTDAIYQLTDREWTRSIYPKLRTKRSQVTVVFSDGCLIIAGGNSAHGPVNTVDVLIITYQDKVWREVARLPYKVFRASGCVCNGVLYILGGYVSLFDPIRSACVATVSQLVESNSNDQGIFNTIKDLEFYDSACVSFCNHILAIGGWKSDAETVQPKGTKLVYVYHTGENVWKELKGQLSEPRCFAFAAAFEDRIMTVGGYDRPNGTCTDSVEFAIIPSDKPEQVCQAPLQSEREAVAFKGGGVGI